MPGGFWSISGSSDVFDDVFDIRDAGYMPKPAPETYDRMIARLAIAPESAVMIEDIARNLASGRRTRHDDRLAQNAHALGQRTGARRRGPSRDRGSGGMDRGA